MTCLVFRAVTKNNYRGICELLRLSPALREAIGLHKVPHWTTLQKFMAKPEMVLIIDVESFLSAMKRTTLATLSSRKVKTLIAEASMKVLAYAIRRR